MSERKAKLAGICAEVSARDLYADCWIAILMITISAAGLAQTQSGTLIGVVKTPDRPLENGHIRLVSDTASQPIRETSTDVLGRFRLTGLSPGAYTVTVEAPGWRGSKIRITLRSNRTLYLNATLPPPASERPVRFSAVDEDVWLGTDFGDFALQRLPNGRNLWPVLQTQEPSTVTNRFQIDEVEGPVPDLFSAFGASWTENQYGFDGLDVTDPYIPGLPLINPDLDAVAEVQVVAASKPAGALASGENVALATPEAGGKLHGGGAFYGSGRPLQSDNLNARLRKFDFPGPERLNSLLDATAQLGGALPARIGAWPFYVSVSTQQVSRDLGGFAAPINTGANRVLVDFTPWSRGSRRLDLLYGGQHVFDSRQGAMPSVAPSATTRGNYNFHQFLGRWNQAFSPATTFRASFGAVNAIVSSGFQPGVQGISTINLPSLLLTGPAPLATSGLRTRYEAGGILQSILYGPLGSHSLAVGLDWNRSRIVNRWYSMGGVLQLLVNGATSEFVSWNTPAQSKQHVQDIAEFVQDSWRPLKWLTLPVGLGVDTLTGKANGVNRGISWTTLEPRGGFVVPIWPPGLVLQGSWSRYGHLLQGRYLDFGNPGALAAQIFRGNAAAPQTAGPLLRVFDGQFSAIDEGIERPFTDEISFGVQQNVANRLSAVVRFFRRDDHRLIGLTNRGVPFSQYTPVQYADPGNDGVAGTADDQVLTLFNENPAALGRDFLLLTNPGLRASYKGFEAVVAARPQKAWEAFASFSAGQTSARTSPGNSPFENDTGFVGSLGIDPNTLVMAQGRTHFDRSFTGKLTAYYAAPHGFYLGAVATYFDGVPFGRLLFVNGFNQGPFFVRATPVSHPGGFQTQLNSTLDVRVARDFRLRRGTFSGYLDVFNLLNVNSNTREVALTGPEFLSRVPLAVEAPRTARLGVAWKF